MQRALCVANQLELSSCDQSNYNFRTYFLRRSRDLFRSNLLPPSQAALSSPFSSEASATTPASPGTLTSPVPSILSSAPPSSEKQTDAQRVAAFYQTAVKDLQVLRRAAVTNRMYQGERLVVEKPQLFVSGGGGAGMEASVGGGGQPTTAPGAKR